MMEIYNNNEYVAAVVRSLVLVVSNLRTTAPQHGQPKSCEHLRTRCAHCRLKSPKSPQPPTTAIKILKSEILFRSARMMRCPYVR